MLVKAFRIHRNELFKNRQKLFQQKPNGLTHPNSGHEVSLAQQYAAIATASIPFFLLAGAGGIVFWVLA